MLYYFPGTSVVKQGKSVSEFLFGIFTATKGLMLAQVKEITNLETPAIQNWVNRGWIQKPVNKRYSQDHLARILIFNMLRDVMKFEKIAALMTYINGNTDDRSDDIISDAQLYIYMCDILEKVDYEIILTEDKLEDAIRKSIGDYVEPYPAAKEKLIGGLHIILIYYAAAIVKVKADKKYIDENIEKGGKHI